jgi:hypothetical protein
MNEKRIARKMLRLAETILSYKDDAPIMDVVKDKKFDMNALKLIEQRDVVLKLIRYFKNSQKEKIEAFEKFKAEKDAKIKELKEQIEKAEKPIKDEFADWSKVGESKYNKLSKMFLENVHRDVETGGNLEELASAIDDVLIYEKESEQDSYKIKYEMLVTALHNFGEYQKYADILDGSSNKIFVYMKTGIKYLDKKIEDWKTNLKEVAEERGLSWDDLLKYTFTKKMRRQEKKSGVLDVIDSIVSATKNLVRGLGKIMSKIYIGIMREDKKIDNLHKDINDIVTKAIKIANK